MKGKWSINPVKSYHQLTAPDFWEDIKPSRLGDNKPAWMTFGDLWVDEVERGLKACAVFCWYPIYCERHRRCLQRNSGSHPYQPVRDRCLRALKARRT